MIQTILRGRRDLEGQKSTSFAEGKTASRKPPDKTGSFSVKIIRMKKLNPSEILEAEHWFEEAAKIAQKSTCLRGHGGSIVVTHNVIVGCGYNSPPLDLETNRTCLDEYSSQEKIRFDKTCCVHAEWRAILDTAKRNPGDLAGSRIYFVRVDGNGKIVKAGQPYCTTCSRLVLESGIAEFALWQEKGIVIYDTVEYDRLSYNFFR